MAHGVSPCSSGSSKDLSLCHTRNHGPGVGAVHQTKKNPKEKKKEKYLSVKGDIQEALDKATPSRHFLCLCVCNISLFFACLFSNPVLILAFFKSTPQQVPCRITCVRTLGMFNTYSWKGTYTSHLLCGETPTHHSHYQLPIKVLLRLCGTAPKAQTPDVHGDSIPGPALWEPHAEPSH